VWVEDAAGKRVAGAKTFEVRAPENGRLFAWIGDEPVPPVI
jgi:hypothetical protein